MAKKRVRRETVVFNGVSYHRYPDSKRRHHRIYYQAHTQWKAPIRYLHRDKYEFYHGPIPSGYVVHHRDDNSLNNEPGNLVCVTRSEHCKLHAKDVKRYWNSTKGKRHRAELNEKAAPKIKAYAESDEGRRSAAKGGRMSRDILRNTKPITKLCQHCGDEFETLMPHLAKYCGDNCRNAAARLRNRDHRKCVICKTEFEFCRYDDSQTCSKNCSSILHLRTKAGL